MSRFTADLFVRAGSPDAPLEACGILAPSLRPEKAWIWVHDLQSDWWGPMESPRQVQGTQVTLKNLEGDPPFEFDAEVWNTWTGEVVDEFQGTLGEKTLTLDLPAFQRDVAVKLSLSPSDDDADDDFSDDDDDLPCEPSADDDDDDSGCCGC